MTRLVLLSCAFLAACGGSKIQPDQQYDLTGGNLDFSHTGDGPGSTSNPDLIGADLIGANADLATVANPPVIVVTMPTSMVDVVGSNLSIVAKVTSPATPPRPITSVIVVVPGDTTMTTTTLTTKTTDGTYTGSRDISAVGAMGTFVITATDSAGGVTSQTVNFRHDAGPVITFLQPTLPMGRTIITASGSIAVQVQVTDALYTVQSVTAAIGEGPVTLTPVAGSSPAQWTGTITFSDYGSGLLGDQQIIVTAQNSQGTTSVATKDFTVDETGPVITINNPLEGLFYGGLITVSATITDISGVNNATVNAVFGADSSFSVTLQPDPNTAGLYTAEFDLHQLGTDYVTPSFDVTAQDSLGNSSTVGYQILIDNTPPIISMDPPNLRVATYQQGVGWICSVSFDPLGTETVNDKSDPSQNAQLITVRARVEDRGNTASGQTVERHSGISQTSVNLYAVPVAAGASTAVAVDTDGDGLCDSINPLLTEVQVGSIATSSQFVELGMVPVPSIGNINYSDTTSNDPNCNQMGEPGATAPGPLCSGAGTSLTYALQYSDPGTAAIWTLPTATANDTDCLGFQFDTLNHLPEGGACFIVSATDNTGNKAVSPPLRTCIRRTSMVNHPCDTWTSAIPNCTGVYNQTTKTITSGKTCTSKAFVENGDVAYQY